MFIRMLVVAVVCGAAWSANAADRVVAEVREVDRPLIVWDRNGGFHTTRLLRPPPGFRYEAVRIEARTDWGNERAKSKKLPLRLGTRGGGSADVQGVLTPFGIYEWNKAVRDMDVRRVEKEAESVAWLEILYAISEGETLALGVGEAEIEVRRSTEPGTEVPAAELETRIVFNRVEDTVEFGPSDRRGADGVTLRHWHPGGRTRRVLFEFNIRSEWLARCDETDLRAEHFGLRKTDGTVALPWGAVVPGRGAERPDVLVRWERGPDGVSAKGKAELLFSDEAGLAEAKIVLMSAKSFAGEDAR